MEQEKFSVKEIRVDITDSLYATWTIGAIGFELNSNGNLTYWTHVDDGKIETFIKALEELVEERKDEIL